MSQRAKLGDLVPSEGAKVYNVFWLEECLWNSEKYDGHLSRVAYACCTSICRVGLCFKKTHELEDATYLYLVLFVTGSKDIYDIYITVKLIELPFHWYQINHKITKRVKKNIQLIFFIRKWIVCENKYTKNAILFT